MADVIITPASGLIDFQNTSGISSATIQLSGTGDLVIGAAAGDIQIGDTSSDIFVGDGVNNVDIVFEQDGEIRGDTGVTVTLGQSDSYIAFAGDITGNVDFTGGLNVTGVSTFGDNVYFGYTDSLYFGDGNDLRIYNDGSNSILRSPNDTLWLQSNVNINITKNNAAETIAQFTPDGSVSLYYDASKKFETTGTGVTVTGITSTTVLHANVGTYDAGQDTKTDSAIVIRTEGKIYTQHGSGPSAGYLRNLISNQSGAINVGETGTSLISSVNLYPGNSGATNIYHGGANKKLETTTNGIKITGGIQDKDGDLGTAGQVLSSTGTELNWIDAASGGGGGTSGLSTGGVYVGSGVTTFNFVGTGITASVTDTTGNVYIPTASRSVSRTVATNGQTTVTGLSYTVGYVDVYLNGARLDSTEFTASNGSSVVLTTGASTGDIIEIVSETVSASISLTGLSDVVSDTTPQLGGNLDLNSRNITGTGNINITGTINASGIITGSSFSGSGANLTSVNASTVTVADESSDTSCNVLYSTSATGDLAVKSGTNLTFNSSNGTLSATTFSGSGASLTSVNAATVTLADETTDTTCFPLFATDATGDRAIKTDGATLTYNASTGALAASSFSGSGASLTSVNAATSTVADESTDTSCFPLFATAASGSLALKSSSNLTYDSSTGVLTAQAFAGDGSAITGLSVTAIPVANEATDTTCFPLFSTAATGNQAIKSNTSLTFNSSEGILSASTFAGSADLSGLLKEDVNVTAGKLSDNQNIDLSTGMIHLFTTAETGISTANIRYDASNTLNSKMNTGESVAVSIIVTAAAAGYGTTITVDGAAKGINWLGGSAPSTGGSSGYDNYTYNIIKTADATFTVLANLVNFA